MKHGKRKYWLDSWASHNHVELYMRWETLIMHDSFQDIRTRERQAIPSYCINNAAIVHDCTGIGVETMPRTWEFWYLPALRRVCVSLWIIAFWFDLPRYPFFLKKKKNEPAKLTA